MSRKSRRNRARTSDAQLSFLPSLYAAEDTSLKARERALSRRLAWLWETPVRVTLHDNRRIMVSVARKAEGVHLRLHHMFSVADDPTLQALFVFVSRRRRSQARADASKVIDAFIAEHRTLIRPEPAEPIYLDGAHHDLSGLYNEINETYFQGALRLQVTWGQWRRYRRRPRSLRLGAYYGERGLIRLHPVLDQAWVPGYFVRYVLFHECLHHVIAPVKHGDRLSYHPPAFREAERAFEDYARAVRWERENLGVLLASCTRRAAATNRHVA